MQRVEHPFPPVADENSRILILGSFPSVASLADGFFYGHPRNRFWPMLSEILDEPLPQSVQEKRALLLRRHIALWDVIATCSIEGSSDASVRDAMPVNILPVLEAAPIRCILLNGALSGRLYRRHLLPITGMDGVTLPSTSPANAAWSLERLVEAWRPYIIG